MRVTLLLESLVLLTFSWQCTAFQSDLRGQAAVVPYHQSYRISRCCLSETRTVNESNNGSSGDASLTRRKALQTAAFAATASAAPANAALSGQIQLPPLGLGAWSWGDSVFGATTRRMIRSWPTCFAYAVNHAPQQGLLLDTAEVYGLGRSETLVGEFARLQQPSNLHVATKFAALPWRTQPSDVVKACQASTQRLGRPIDLYQIHFPGAWSNAEYWDGLADAYEQGLVKSVGVSNYGVDALRACHAALKERGIQLASNQIQLSLLYPYALQNGLVDACKELGVQVLAYSPMALGFLTGKYTRESGGPSGPRGALYKSLLSTPDYENLLTTMQDVATKHDNASPAQVALNWARAKGGIPIPGARSVRQIQSNFNALTWMLSDAEVKRLDDTAAKVTTFTKPETNPFPKVDKNTGLKMYDS